MHDMTYILFDIGGTNMRVTVTRDGTSFGEPEIVPTPKDFDNGTDTLISIIGKLTKGEPITAIGGGIAGPLDRYRTKLVNSPHLHGWVGKPIKEILEQRLSAPVHIENDTAIVGLGEATAGAGRGREIVAYITVSTGVGGVRIVRERVDVSASGFEPGHQIIDAGGGLLLSNEPPFPGVTLEEYISGSSVERRYGKKPYMITEADFWDRMARLLAYGLNNTIVHWSPDIVVIGGSMMKKIGIPVDRVRAHLRGILHIYPELPDIVKAELGDVGGLYGALHHIRTKEEERMAGQKSS